MICVCIESPFMPKLPRDQPSFAAELQRNIEYARALVLDSLRRGEAPYASHLFFPQVFAGGNDRDPVERQLGIDAGTAWALRADLIVVGTDLGISAGMQQRLERLALMVPKHSCCRPVIDYRSLPEWAAARARWSWCKKTKGLEG